MIPADIDEVEFKTTRVKEGYDQEEVDNFLDRVRAAWATESTVQANEIASLKRQLAEAQRIADAYDVTAPLPAPSPAESATRILEFAQKTADDVMADAKAKADEMVFTARNEAERLKNEARAVVQQNQEILKELQSKEADTKEFLRGYFRRCLNDLEDSGG